jgi:hypothetical protein
MAAGGCQWQNPDGPVPHAQTFPSRHAGAVSASRRFRGLGRGRQTRRALERGGAGPARALNEAIGRWHGVRITPMFGRWGYFVGERLFACFPLRERDHDLWIRLGPEDQARALAETGVRPHRRFARRGWVEVNVDGPADVGRALRWLRRAHATTGRMKEEEHDG